MDLIETYLNNLQTINSMTLDDFGDRRKVKRNNKLADANRQIAKDIENTYPEYKEDFAKLLLHDDWKIRCQVAHHMLEVMNYPNKYRKMALREIKDVINKDILVESLGNKMWLQDWYKQHPLDRFL
ncbi:MAG: hypothetical protein E7283_02340 [Lachnospiraceae bacterium]|nr:hypothetical protein [Lachnospiraceae bacterium]